MDPVVQNKGIVFICSLSDRSLLSALCYIVNSTFEAADKKKFSRKLGGPRKQVLEMGFFSTLFLNTTQCSPRRFFLGSFLLLIVFQQNRETKQGKTFCNSIHQNELFFA